MTNTEIWNDICVYVHIQGTRLQEKKMVTGMIPICSVG